MIAVSGWSIRTGVKVFSCKHSIDCTLVAVASRFKWTIAVSGWSIHVRTGVKVFSCKFSIGCTIVAVGI